MKDLFTIGDNRIGAPAEMHLGVREINARIRANGVIWRPCGGCGLDWPFPRPVEDESVIEYRCQVCVTAQESTRLRESR